MEELSWMLILTQAWRSSFLNLHCHYSPWSLSVQFSCSFMSDSATPWTAAHQASLPITNSQSLLKLMSIELVMPSNHLILCHPLLLPPSIFPSIRVFSNESTLPMRCQSIGVSALASVLPVNIQDWFPLGWTGWIQPKGTLRSLLSLVKLLGIEKMVFFFFSVSILLTHVCSC